MSLKEAAAGNFVEVSGPTDDHGFVQAICLRKTADAYIARTEVQAQGMASEVNTLARTFKINQLPVDYSTADVSSLQSSVPHAFQRLEVRGILSSGGTLTASRVNLEEVLCVDNANIVDISGIVTLFNSINDFEITGIEVWTDSVTEYKGTVLLSVRQLLAICRLVG